MCFLQPKADHQGTENPFLDFRWIGFYIVEKVLLNNKYSVRKPGRNKTQVLLCMRLRLFTPRQPTSNVQNTSQEQKPNPEIIIKHDDLYARA